jgi:hypothetical protein
MAVLHSRMLVSNSGLSALSLKTAAVIELLALILENVGCMSTQCVSLNAQLFRFETFRNADGKSRERNRCC